jgi:acetylornithine deacetylase
MKVTSFFLSVLTPAWCALAAEVIQHPLQAAISAPSKWTPPLLALHKSLIEAPSVSLAERNVSDVLKNYLRSKGFTVEAQPVEGDRENVFAYLGKSRDTKILVTSHLDTVPPFFPYERRGDEIWGRGSADAKGSVATQVIAVESMIAEGKIAEGDVALLYVVGEEFDGKGMTAANSLGLSWKTVIFGEPTGLKLVRGHKGGMSFILRAKGTAGHSSYPELGKNAIDLLVRGLAALQVLELPRSEKYGESTLNIGRIEGGVAANVIPEDAFARGLLRVAASTPAHIIELIKDAVYKASPELVVEYIGGRGPVDIDDDIEG